MCWPSIGTYSRTRRPKPNPRADCRCSATAFPHDANRSVTRSTAGFAECRTQVLSRCCRRNYDRTAAGLGTGKVQRYFASDWTGFLFAYSTLGGSERSKSAFSRLLTLSEIAVVVAGSLQHRGTERSASTAMQYWIEKKLTKASYTKLPELFQSVEKKGKYASSIAWTVCRPKGRLDRPGLQSD